MQNLKCSCNKMQYKIKVSSKFVWKGSILEKHYATMSNELRGHLYIKQNLSTVLRFSGTSLSLDFFSPCFFLFFHLPLLINTCCANNFSTNTLLKFLLPLDIRVEIKKSNTIKRVNTKTWKMWANLKNNHGI